MKKTGYFWLGRYGHKDKGEGRLVGKLAEDVHIGDYDGVTLGELRDEVALLRAEVKQLRGHRKW
jgi:hypothetical protein